LFSEDFHKREEQEIIIKEKRVQIRTSQSVQFVNIDQHVEEAVRESGISSGSCIVFVPHTTAGVTINENADPDVVRDMVMAMNKLVPFQDGYHHSEGNSAAHIKSTLVGPSLTLIVDGGRPLLGVWQSVYFCEFDGPRTRTVVIKVLEG
jgi:secondary thiamine-phosphate synthase enzyme